MSTEKLDALIVRNLRDLDVATKRLWCDIESRMSKAIDEITENWAREHEWEGEFEWNKPEYDVWLAPPTWKASASTDEWLGSFYFYAGFGDDFDFEEDNNLDVYWLTRLCHAGRGILCFRWTYDDGLGATKTKWKRFVNDAAGDWVNRIRKVGFTYDEGTGLFFMPVRVEAETLAAAIEEDAVEGALKPSFQQALDKLLAAQPEFNAMLEGAKTYFSD
jgi:hypothetical protein